MLDRPASHRQLDLLVPAANVLESTEFLGRLGGK
jgi:hypothetical protein